MKIKVDREKLKIDNEGIWFVEENQLKGFRWERIKEIKILSIHRSKTGYFSALTALFFLFLSVFKGSAFTLLSAVFLIPFLIVKPVVRLVLEEGFVDLIFQNSDDFRQTVNLLPADKMEKHLGAKMVSLLKR